MEEKKVDRWKEQETALFLALCLENKHQMRGIGFPKSILEDLADQFNKKKSSNERIADYDSLKSKWKGLLVAYKVWRERELIWLGMNNQYFAHSIF
jgi:hypothetical protein